VSDDKYFLDAAAGYSVYLTTSTVGREKGLWFPGERGGLEYWLEAVSPESDLRPLRAVLDMLSLHSERRAWVRAATDAQVREQLLARIEWLYGALNLSERAKNPQSGSRETLRTLRTPAQRKSTWTRRNYMRLLNVAAGQEERTLTRSDLDELLEEATTVRVPAATAILFSELNESCRDVINCATSTSYLSMTWLMH